MTGESPIGGFAQTHVQPKLRHFQPFACPAYVLKNELQANRLIPKWEPWLRLGMYLGPSPRHSRSTSLILNLETGLASPQHHLRYDNFFETIRNRKFPNIKWQQKCHFAEPLPAERDEPIRPIRRRRVRWAAQNNSAEVNKRQSSQ